MDIPRKIGSLEIAHYAILDDTCTHTKNCVNEISGKVLGAAIWAAITKASDGEQCYLFFCYPEGELTDSLHESVSEAKEQAEWEYFGIKNRWKLAT